jgi:hypothetical protein
MQLLLVITDVAITSFCKKENELGNNLSEIPYSWVHETGAVNPAGNTILDLLEASE